MKKIILIIAVCTVGISNFLILYFSGNSTFNGIIFSIPGIILLAAAGYLSGYFKGGSSKQQHAADLLSASERKRQESEKTLQEYRNMAERLEQGAVYRGPDVLSIPDNPNKERFLSILCEYIVKPKSSDRIAKYFTILSGLYPRILAVMDLKGGIISFNPTIMALYGYYKEKEITGRNILEFIIAENHRNASENIGTAVFPGINGSEKYTVKTKDGRVVPSVISSSFTFKTSGNPLSLLAILSDGSGSDESNPGELLKKNIWILAGDALSGYISPPMAELLGFTVEEASGKPVSYFLDERGAETFGSILNSCRDNGKDGKFSIEFVKRDGTCIYTFINTMPILDPKGKFLGIIFHAEDKTERRIVEEALQHRLSIEKLISGVSTRFINIKPNELDREIENSLKAIGDFLDAIKSYVIIFPGKKTGGQKQFSVENIHHIAIKEKAKKSGNTPDNADDSLETTSVPVVIDSEMAGFFRFDHKKSEKTWMDEDIILLKLVGEILVNALIRTQDEEKLAISQERLKITLHSIGDAVISTDNDGKAIMLNSAAEELIGWKREEAVGKPLDIILNIVNGTITEYSMKNDIEDKGFLALMDSGNNIVLRSKDGTERTIDANKSPILDDYGNKFGEVIVFRDITEKRRKEEEILYLSFHDKLTGLFNRAFMEAEMLRLDTKRQYPITIIVGDLNGLKIANDIFGHAEGDRLLQKIAKILKASARKEDIISRWGGDEFAVLLPKTSEITGTEVRKRILDACASAESSPIQPSIALGIASKTEESQDIQKMLKDAEDRMYRHKLLEGKSARSAIISSLGKTLFEKSLETEEHARRMLSISTKIGKAIGLTASELDELKLLAVLHDMGKIGIPDNILKKPGKLSKDEWEEMKKHPEKGYQIAGSSQELSYIAEYILHHHEHWDGTGYPKGLKGNEIPRLSRILTIVDTYDVITHSRVYKDIMSHNEAIEEIRRCAGTQFDPELTEIFIQVMGNGENLETDESAS
ncbi:MAG: PAS domain S-box protein [Ruminiclostridium sp.]|nr:PAS domain S-box protein [Ruminiclostridium sp.]